MIILVIIAKLFFRHNNIDISIGNIIPFLLFLVFIGWLLIIFGAVCEFFDYKSFMESESGNNNKMIDMDSINKQELDKGETSEKISVEALSKQLQIILANKSYLSRWFPDRWYYALRTFSRTISQYSVPEKERQKLFNLNSAILHHIYKHDEPREFTFLNTKTQTTLADRLYLSHWLPDKWYLTTVMFIFIALAYYGYGNEKPCLLFFIILAALLSPKFIYYNLFLLCGIFQIIINSFKK